MELKKLSHWHIEAEPGGWLEYDNPIFSDTLRLIISKMAHADAPSHPVSKGFINKETEKRRLFKLLLVMLEEAKKKILLWDEKPLVYDSWHGKAL